MTYNYSKNDGFYEEFCQAYYENRELVELLEILYYPYKKHCENIEESTIKDIIFGIDEEDNLIIDKNITIEALIDYHKEHDCFEDEYESCRYSKGNNKTFEEKRLYEYNLTGIFLDRCIKIIELISSYHPELNKYTKPVKIGLEILDKEYKKGLLITIQLQEVMYFIEDIIFKEKLNISKFIYSIGRHKFNLKEIEESLQLKFKWKYTEDDIIDAVRNEVNWRDAERDITIYKERKKGVLIKNLMKTYNLDKGSISRIAKKVEGKVNYLKGHLFEEEYKKYLKSLKIYDKVDNIGTSGEPDILCHKEDTNQLDVYSLKMLKITKQSYFISKNELAPEYKIAYDQSFSYKTINLFLVVFNYLNNEVITIPLDWKNPKDVIIK